MNIRRACGTRIRASVLIVGFLALGAFSYAPDARAAGDQASVPPKALSSMPIINPADGTLVVTDAGRVTIFDVASGRALSSFDGTSAYRAGNGDTILGVHSGVDGYDATTTVILAADGVQRAIVGQHSSQASIPILSPDGSLIAMVFQLDLPTGRFITGTLIYRRDGVPQLHRDRGPLRAHVAFFPGCTPEDWTPDGRLLTTCDVPPEARAYLTNSREKWLCITSARFDNLFIINRALSGATPSVSPDGQRVAYVHRDNVWVARMDGSDPQQITDGDQVAKPRGPVWSPDGKWLAVQGDEGVPDGRGSYNFLTYLYLVSPTTPNQRLSTPLVDERAVPIRTGHLRASWR